MEITDFSELNALNKLLGKIKFQEDLDFFEFKEFVGSPLIASIYKRVNDEFLIEAKKRGYFSNLEVYSLSFELESQAGKAIIRRMQEWTEHERETLLTLKKDEFENLLWTLITPYNCLENEFEKLKEYAIRIINKKSSI